MENQYDLNRFASLLVLAKKTENRAREKRIGLEERIADLVPTKETGQKTLTLDDGTKITVKRGLNYKTDFDGLRDTCSGSAINCIPPIKSKTTYELDIKGYEYYRVNCPDSFHFLSRHVTVTPKKVAVEVKVK